MMSPEFRRHLLLPAVLCFLGLYLIGFRMVQHRRSLPEPPSATATSTVQASDQTPSELMRGEKININTASKSELMRLDGIGSVLANRIIEMREDRGGFISPDELLSVQGIGEHLYRTLEDYIITE